MKYASGSSVGERGQITIERSIRERLGIRPKDVAVQRIEGRRLVVEFIRPHEPHMRSLAGILGPAPARTPATGKDPSPEASVIDDAVGRAIAEEWGAYLTTELPSTERDERATTARRRRRSTP